MTDPGARTRRTYDAIAGDFLARTRDRAPLLPNLERFAARLPPGARVLDVGAGPGTDSAALRARGLRVVSIDLSLGMLRQGMAEFPGPRVQADMRRLPFGGVAHGLWLNASLLHVERDAVPDVLRELRRVLVAPALLHVSLKRGTSEGWESERYGVSHPRWFTFWTEDAFDALLAAAGFRVLAAETRVGSQDTWIMRLATAQA